VKIRSGLTFLFLHLFLSTLVASPQAHFDDLVESGVAGVRFDNDDSLGDYILAVSMLELSQHTNLSTAVETVRILAQRELASVLGSKMTAKTVSETKSTSMTVDGETKEKLTEFFSDFVQVETNQFLRGAYVFDSRVIENQIFVGFLLSEVHVKDASNLASLAGGSPSISFDNNHSPKRDLKVEAVGMAEVRGGQLQQAREDALASARRNAVEHAMGVTVVATGQVRNLDPDSARFKNFSMSLGEVLRSKVLAEGQEGRFYKVKIAALVTAADFSRELGKYMSAIGNPLFYVDYSSGNEIGDEFSIFFKDIGFKITENLSDADYLIRLRSRFIDREHPTTFKTGTQLQLTLEIVDPINQKVLLVHRNNPRTSTNFLSDPSRRRQLVAEKALFGMENTLRDKIGKLIADMVQNGREIEISFRGSSKLNEKFTAFISDQLEWIPGTSDSQSTFSPGSLKFSLRYLGATDLLTSTLLSETNKAYPDSSLVLVSLKPNHLTFTLN
jgi:hypothetical protein